MNTFSNFGLFWIEYNFSAEESPEHLYLTYPLPSIGLFVAGIFLLCLFLHGRCLGSAVDSRWQFECSAHPPPPLPPGQSHSAWPPATKLLKRIDFSLHHGNQLASAVWASAWWTHEAIGPSRMGGIEKPDPFYWVQLLTTVIPQCFPMSSSRQKLGPWIEVKGLLNLFWGPSIRGLYRSDSLHLKGFKVFFFFSHSHSLLSLPSLRQIKAVRGQCNGGSTWAFRINNGLQKMNCSWENYILFFLPGKSYNLLSCI